VSAKARLQENIFHGQALGLWPLKMDKPWFFSDKPEKNPFYKISSYQGFPIKQTHIGFMSPLSRTVIRNPRRNIELIPPVPGALKSIINMLYPYYW